MKNTNDIIAALQLKVVADIFRKKYLHSFSNKNENGNVNYNKEKIRIRVVNMFFNRVPSSEISLSIYSL